MGYSPWGRKDRTELLHFHSLNLLIPFLSIHHLTTSLPIQVRLPGVLLQPPVARTLNALDPVSFYCQPPSLPGNS